MPGTFHWVDWGVLLLYVFGTSWLADRLAGKGQTVRDFFLGGRKLPWYAVSGSIVASEVSGVTFVSVPLTAFTGDYTYMMLAIGSVLARFVIAGWLVPAYYRHEIYSPYEFMGRRLGPEVDRLATVIFFVGSFLAQGARLYLAAMVLNAITHMGIVWAVLLIGAISVVWTWLGGINSVVWTDVVQFVVLFVGGVVALGAVIAVVPGGLPEILRQGLEDGKFRIVDLTLDRTTAYTLWCGILGSTFLTMSSHGTDQNMAQRLFCCKDERDARKAILWSSVSQVLPLLMLTVGVGIYVYFKRNPMSAGESELFRENKNNLFPIFILKAMPVGVKGLLFAAIFSAATATGTLAAMAQTALTTFYKPFFGKGASEAHLIRVSRFLVLVAAAGLCGTALLVSSIKDYPNLLDLALAMAGYTYGAMLGILLLALLPLGRDARGLYWGVPFSMLLIFALNWQQESWGRWIVALGTEALSAWAAIALRREPFKLGWVLLAAGAVLAVALMWLPNGEPFKLAFPWHYPIGAAVTLGLGIALGRKRLATAGEASVSSPP